MLTLKRFFALVFLALLFPLVGCSNPAGPVRKAFREKFPLLAEYNDTLLKIVDEESAKAASEGPLKRLDERWKEYEEKAKKLVESSKKDAEVINALKEEGSGWGDLLQRGDREVQGFHGMLRYNLGRLEALHNAVRAQGVDPASLRKTIDDFKQKFLKEGADLDLGFKELTLAKPKQ